MIVQYAEICSHCHEIIRVVEVDEADPLPSCGSCPNCHKTQTLELFECKEEGIAGEPRTPSERLAEECDPHPKPCCDSASYGKPCNCGTFKRATTIEHDRGATPDQVKNPSHYTSYEFEVYEAIKYLLNTHYQDATPYDIWQVGNELKYRFRAGFKEDGHNGAQDLAKAMRCRQMRDE